MERYDAAIIGAGPEGLIAAFLLARAKLKVVVLERGPSAGGRATTLEFHPGFKASPYADELAPIPRRLFWDLAPARFGAVMAPAPMSVSVSDAGPVFLFADHARMARMWGSHAQGISALRSEIADKIEKISAQALSPMPAAKRKGLFVRTHARAAGWPGESWGRHALAELLQTWLTDPKLRLHFAAEATQGRAASPFLSGTGLHLLAAGPRSGIAVGGMAAFAAALEAQARAAGAEIRTGADVSDIRIAKKTFRGRYAAGVALTDGEEVMARAVLSTLDIKRTFLSLFPWSGLSPDLVKRLGQFRIGGQTARVLFALDGVPEISFARDLPESLKGPIHVVPSLTALGVAQEHWRSATLTDAPPVTVRFPSLADPSLAPAGSAVMTATIGAVPHRLFDGDWTGEKRERLAALALNAVERIAPGISSRIVRRHIIAPPDIEAGLGVTTGDLDGGEIAPDQAFSFRPFPEWQGCRTGIGGLYLGGGSTAPGPFLTGATGARAASAIMADIAAGRLG